MLPRQYVNRADIKPTKQTIYCNFKMILHETINGTQKIVVERSLHCGTARTRKKIVFLTLAQ